VISEKEFTKVLIPPLRGGSGGFVLMVQTQKHPYPPSRGEFDLGKFFSGNHLKCNFKSFEVRF